MIDMYLSLSAFSGEVVPLHIVDVMCVILCAGVIGSDVPWLECPACNALIWVIAVTE